MSYSDLYFESKKKHGGVLLIIALFSIFGFIGFIYSNNSLKTTKASGEKLPDPPKVVNLLSFQAGIFWKTNAEETSWISYGSNKNRLDQIAQDVRNTETNKTPYLYHYVFLTDLKEGQTYYYKIITDKVIFDNGDGQPFTFTTPRNISIKSMANLAYGTVLQTNNSPATDVFVMFNFENYFPLLAMTKSGGTFTLAFGSVVEKKTNNIVIPKLDEKVNIVIFNNTQLTNIKALLSQTKPFSQSIILGKDYDFIAATGVLGVNSTDSPIIQGKSNTNSSEIISIIYPKENSVIAGQKPLIKGTALPNKTVFISINSRPEYSFRSVADSKGDWSAVPPAPIANGSYILTMTTTDNEEKEVVIKRQFTIAKSGEKVLGEATAEPTLIVEVPTPTLTPSAEQFFTPTTAPPKTGMNTNFLVFVSSSLIILGLGILLVF